MSSTSNSCGQSTSFLSPHPAGEGGGGKRGRKERKPQTKRARRIGMRKRMKSTETVDEERKEEGKKQMKQWATKWKTSRVRKQKEKDTKKETMTLHSLCSRIYPWVDMLHEHHDIDSMWQTHTHNTKQNVKWASGEAHSALLFVVVFFCALKQKTFDRLCTTTFERSTWHDEKNNTYSAGGKRQQTILWKKPTLVRRIVCLCVCVLVYLDNGASGVPWGKWVNVRHKAER